MALLKKDVEENLDSQQYERANKFSVSQMCIGYTFRRLGVAYKKNVSASKGGNKEKRTMFKNRIARYKE